MAYYLDTSAAAKLVVAEHGSAAMTAWAAAHDGQVVASDLLRTELLRATRRVAPASMPRARDVLDALILVGLSSATFEHAGGLGPDGMRSLDALHLAAALDLGDDLDGLVTYDARLADEATRYGVKVLAPQ